MSTTEKGSTPSGSPDESSPRGGPGRGGPGRGGPGQGGPEQGGPGGTGAGIVARMMSVTGLPPRGLVGIAVSVLLGVLVWVVGLPGDGVFLGATMSDLTLPAGLLVMLGGI